MLTKRIIPCLDVRDGKVVKGVQFRKHIVLGDVLELAQKYSDHGADELVFYDITASAEGRSIDPTWVEQTARCLNIPFCVAGGIRSVADARRILNAGAEKVSINSPALERPELITELAEAFGVQAVVVGIDSHFEADAPHPGQPHASGDYYVYKYTGSATTMRPARKRTMDWIKEVQDLGAGEIVLNCMNQDGVGRGYDIEQLQAARSMCRVPLIASGGAGKVAHFGRVFEEAKVDGALAAGMFHRNEIRVFELKRALSVDYPKIPLRIEDSTPILPWLAQSDLAKAWHTPLRKPELDYSKMHEPLIPAVIQHAATREVLMQGYMNEEAVEQTVASRKATFYSRSKKRLWTKGESSQNFLFVLDIQGDCDSDSLVLSCLPAGPACHLGTRSCFSPREKPQREHSLQTGFLAHLDYVIQQRKLQAQDRKRREERPSETRNPNKSKGQNGSGHESASSEEARSSAESPPTSYTERLFLEGLDRIAQKVGEEGVEVVIASKNDDPDALIGECADLMFHLQVLLAEKQLSLADVLARLEQRHK